MNKTYPMHHGFELAGIKVEILDNARSVAADEHLRPRQPLMMRHVDNSQRHCVSMGVRDFLASTNLLLEILVLQNYGPPKRGTIIRRNCTGWHLFVGAVMPCVLFICIYHRHNTPDFTPVLLPQSSADKLIPFSTRGK